MNLLQRFLSQAGAIQKEARWTRCRARRYVTNARISYLATHVRFYSAGKVLSALTKNG
jgi:hypothetical protein